MNPASSAPEEESLDIINRNLLRLLVVAAIAGIAVGIVGGCFHWLLLHGQATFTQQIAYWKTNGFLGLPGWVAASAIAGMSVGLARWLIRFAPSASGSGIQHVEAVIRGQASPAPLRALPIKFIGGLLAMIPGMALGREGPTVQMAAVIGSQCGRIFGLNREDKFLLYTAVAGAGLSVAFNAPMAGVAFVVEEVSRRVTTRRLLTTLIAVGTSIAIFRAFFGNAIAFNIDSIKAADATSLLIFAGFGIFLGAAGVLYNKSILLGLNLFSKCTHTIPPEIGAAVVGAIVGLLAYWQPFWVGGGEAQIQNMLSHVLNIKTLVIMLLIRWVLGPASYAPGLPGGLFAPLLLVGATLGAILATATNMMPSISGGADIAAFVMVGMAAFFTAVVRAPFTGVLLIIEMSGSVALTPALLVACVSAALTASLLRAEPIYDSLRARMTTR